MMMDINNSLLILIVSIFSSAFTQDRRCYLENGGSAESFFVSEDFPVGSVIGSLKIFGDVSEFGNIVLRLKELDSPVSIVPFTKNLSLVHRLDKEGLEGPASVFINVVCDRKRTIDPSFIIPVNIRVIDVNDNAPQFINAPYQLSVSEVTVVGTKVLQGIRAVDIDQQGPFATVHYSVVSSKYSDYFEFANGLDGTLILKKPLDYETLPNFTITIRAQDQGNPPLYSDSSVQINVIDADDQNPKFVDDAYFAVIPDHPIQGTKLKLLPRDIEAYDQDVGIKAPIYYLFNSDGSDYSLFEIKKDTGFVYIKTNITDDQLQQPALLVIKAIQYDNADKYALATLTVSRAETSHRNVQFLHSHYYAAVLENVPVHSVLLTVTTNKSQDKKLHYWLHNFYEMFGVTSDGEITLEKPLDYELIDNYVFLVFASDTYTNASAVVNITVLNVNDWDPRFRYPQYEFFISNVSSSQQLTPGTLIGTIEAADGDRDDRVTLSLRGPYARLFSISDAGEIKIQELIKTNTSTIHLVAVATDSGTPPRQASVPVIIHLPQMATNSADYWILSSSSSFVMISFIAISIVLSLVIITLIIYIQKYKTQKQRVCPNLSRFFRNEDKSITAFGKIENPVFNSNSDVDTMQHTSTEATYTATVKRTSSHGCPARSKMLYSPASTCGSKIIPSPPKIPSEINSSDETEMGISEENNELFRSDVWAVNPLTNRTRNLNWTEEHGCIYKKTRLDPDVSVTPLVNDTMNLEHLNLTVYF